MAIFSALFAVPSVAGSPKGPRAGDSPVSNDARLRRSFRKPARQGWIYVHLAGTPGEMGYQHGFHLASEIADAQKAVANSLEHDTRREWAFFRKAAEEIVWPKIEPEYREELLGISEGLSARGGKLDLWDIVALNGFLELGPYYIPWLDRVTHHPDPPHVPLPERCSAMIATGNFTRDGQIVMAHNNWSGYVEGARWNIIFDIEPAKGYRILMDGFPGLIHSGDDFGVNGAGLMITETTISGFAGYDPNGIPEFVRARKAMQYADSIDAFVRIMTTGNNGGYANNWLVGDRKTGEIASLELGLKNVTLQRTTDGYFTGSNQPQNPKLAAEETSFSLDDKSLSANARHQRWEQLMAQYKGQIDVELSKQFLADHYDVVEGKADPNERTLCGHVDLSPRGVKGWLPPFAAAGAVQSKVTDSHMAERMSFDAAMGHSCGLTFRAHSHLRRHPESRWQRPYLKDLPSYPWTSFGHGAGQ